MSFDYKRELFSIPLTCIPCPLQLFFDLGSSSGVGENLVYSPTQISILSLGQKKILIFILTYIPGILRSYLMVLSRSDIGNHWFGKTVLATGNTAIIMISHFLYLPLFLWQKHTFSTLFCISFCSGSSEQGVLSLAGQALVLTSLTEDVPFPQPRHTDRLGENPSHVPLGKQLPQA